MRAPNCRMGRAKFLGVMVGLLIAGCGERAGVARAGGDQVPLASAGSARFERAGVALLQPQRAKPPAERRTSVVVDSILPIEEEVRRFRAAVPEGATVLSGGSATLDGLVGAFVVALEHADADALRRLVLDPAEFIDLYFPHTPHMRPPYLLDPAIVWSQMQNYGSRGISRALRSFGGSELGYRGFSCPPPTAEGPNTTRDGCVITIAPPGGAEIDVRLFGTIIERDGRFKFVSYSNDL